MRIKLDDGAYMPVRAHDTDAGLDLMSREDAVIPAGGSHVFDTGVHVELPFVYLMDDIYVGDECPPDLVTAGLLKSKSGLNINHNITSEGVVDVGFTGSIRVKLYNHGTKDYEVKRGDKITQLVIVPVLTPQPEVVSELEETERGENGFGSTGR